MCLAVPGKIVSITDGDSPILRSGKVDFGGVARDVSLACVPKAGVGDYVIVHAGCAISQLDEEEAEKTLADLEALADATFRKEELGE
jgi:hydrogenase expression/formation protein HypC